jgi:hypothetical protein
MNKKTFVLLFSVVLFVASAFAQSYQQGKILKWDIEPYGKRGGVTRNAAVYYIQVANTVYQITRGTTKPDPNLSSGKVVNCRTEKDQMYFPGDNGKEVKYAIIGATETQ